MYAVMYDVEYNRMVDSTQSDDLPVIDLEPEWTELAAAFDQRAQDARKQGKDLAHTIWTDLAVKAEDGDLSKRQAYYWSGVTEIDEDEARKRLGGE